MSLLFAAHNFPLTAIMKSSFVTTETNHKLENIPINAEKRGSRVYYAQTMARYQNYFRFRAERWAVISEPQV